MSSPRHRVRLIRFAPLVLLFALAGCNTPTITDGGPGGGGGGHTASRLHITGQPSAVLAGHAITPPVRVVVADSSLIAVTSSTAPISLSAFSIVTDTLRGVTTRNAVSGTAIFSGLVLDSAGSFRIVASSPGLASDTSEVFVVGHAVADTVIIDLGNTAADTVAQIAFTSERNLSSNPSVDTLPVGGVIKWLWRGTRTHGVLATSGNLIYSSGNFSAPKQLFLDMNDAGTFQFECSVHGASMTAQVVVE